MPASPSPALVWSGRIASALPVIALIGSGGAKIAQVPQVYEMLTTHFGYSPSVVVPLGIIEATCALLYAIPQTTFFGAVLLTGYLGGAVATHVHAGESPVAPFTLGVLLWVGLALRNERLRDVILNRT